VFTNNIASFKMFGVVPCVRALMLIYLSLLTGWRGSDTRVSELLVVFELLLKSVDRDGKCKEVPSIRRTSTSLRGTRAAVRVALLLP